MNYYEILGIGPKASDQEIKEAYRREAMKWHPDRHDGAAAKAEADRRFKDLAVAYRTLRNPSSRVTYDHQLEQQLRREYESRQQEQARQQRAQNERAQREQSQQKQARAEQSDAGFSDTKPPFEDETASSADANQMFYEQMLDLAFELAGRGFPEFNILKALIALGCPEALAKAAAATAAKQGQNRDTNGVDDKREVPPLSNFDEASFEEMTPYYVAAIMGDASSRVLKNEQFESIQSKRDSRSKFWLIVGYAALTLFTILGAKSNFKADELIGLAILSVLLIVVLRAISVSRFLGPDRADYLVDRKRRHYLKVFKALHAESKGGPSLSHFSWTPFFASVLWLGYRRISLLSYIFVALVGIVGIVFSFFANGAYSWVSTMLGIGVAAYIGFNGQRWYFNQVRADIKSAVRNASVQQALIKLRKGGGVTHMGWMFPALLSIILTAPVMSNEFKRLGEKERIAAAERAAQTTASATQRNSRPQPQIENEYDIVLAGIEARYPELNPDSPSFNKAALDWVAERKAQYDQGGGRTPVVALQQAVTDYTTALQRSQSDQRNVQPESVPPLDPYISYVKSLSMRDRHFQTIADMGTKFPMINGYLSYAKSDFRPAHFDQANLVEQTQTWGFNRDHGPQGGFIVFQNRTRQQLKGIVLEIQAEERPCTNKGGAYFMNLEFDRPVPSSALIGINFQFPNAIPNGNRCTDVVDLIYD